MADNNINMPGGFGGLMRFNEEYDSKLKFKPSMVIVFVIAIIVFVVLLNLLFPV